MAIPIILKNTNIMKAAANRLNNQVLQDWTTEFTDETKHEAKISYLMVEQIAPPDYLWDKITNKLDKQQQNTTQAKSINLSKPTTIALMVAAASTAVAVILYWLI